MRRSHFLRILMAVMTIGIASLATPRLASAQPQNLACCNMTFDVNLPPSCAGVFPITMTTDWCPTGLTSYTVATNGLTPTNVPGACPPFAPYFLSIQLPGGPAVPLGSAGTVVIGGCVITYVAGTDASGCIYITMR